MNRLSADQVRIAALQYPTEGLFWWLGGQPGCVLVFWHVSWINDVWSEGKERMLPCVCTLNSSYSLRGNRCWQHPFFLSLSLCLSINLWPLSHTLFLYQLHPKLPFPNFPYLFPFVFPSSITWSTLLSLLLPLYPIPNICLCVFECFSPLSFFFYILVSLSFLSSLPAVRSWVLRSGSGWRVPVVRAWRAGRRPSTTANALPLATRWWAAQIWWVGALPKCRRAGASMIGPGLGRHWGWRARLALLSQMVSGTMCVCPSYY